METGESLVILGIPFANVSFAETLAAIFSMIAAYRQDKRPRLLATANVDFVVNTLSWRGQQSRHPELLDILRRADLVVADGMPLVWASRWLGMPLKERVAGSDLVPALAAASDTWPLSCYFLGGRGDVGARAAKLLKEKHPNFHIAGVDAPFIHIAGEALHEAWETDAAIVAKINEARPDILLIALGNPKQELWFNRNRFRLKVPVTIGVGGTFEFVAGTVKRAPQWMQRLGLEWLHRISQDPWRLWKRYWVDAYTFSLQLLPALLYDRYHRWRQYWRRGREGRQARPGPLPPLAAGEPLRVVTLPPRVDCEMAYLWQPVWQQALAEPQSLVLDCAAVTYIDAAGLGLLMQGWRQAQVQQRGFFLIRVTRRLQRFLRLNRVWDLFSPLTHENVEEVLALLKERLNLPSFSFTLEHRPHHILMRLQGRLDAAALVNLDIPAVLARLAGDHIVIHLADLNFIDSSGLGFLLKIHRYAASQGKSCVLCGPRPTVQQVLLVTRLHRFFTIKPDLTELEQPLGEGYARHSPALS
ncbi:MAG: WecB/TagA/CpsF family glycosyltransferase [Desulfobacca sp.]|uniref:WecB/TagA/CpsF family glycosyltransferase n=1 Tax=Desulfobacca sp. TaxID=2067990 RepID=UPI0040490CB7